MDQVDAKPARQPARLDDRLRDQPGDLLVFENVGAYTNVLRPPFILPASPILALDGDEVNVVVHEFAHGIVAYRGGDYTIKERGGLTLNPIPHIDPIGSLLIPALLIALLGRGRTDIGKDAGYAYASNTLGAIAGSIAGGFGLLPLLSASGAWKAAVVAMLEGGDLRDTFRVKQPEASPVGTFTGFKHGQITGEKIDYVFASGEWDVIDAQIVRDAAAEGYEFIKVYSKLNLETFTALIDEARSAPLVVQWPTSMPWRSSP